MNSTLRDLLRPWIASAPPGEWRFVHRPRLPDLNEALDARRRVFTIRARPGVFQRGDRWSALKSREQTHVMESIRQALANIPSLALDRAPLFDAVRLRFLWIEPDRRRDPDNFTSIGRKIVLDALVAMGVLRNDGWSCVLGWEDHWITWPDGRRAGGVAVGLTPEKPLDQARAATGPAAA